MKWKREEKVFRPSTVNKSTGAELPTNLRETVPNEALSSGSRCEVSLATNNWADL